MLPAKGSNIRMLANCGIRMFWSKRNSEEHRYYCLPGMGRSNRRHRRRVHMAAILVGAVMSVLFGAAVYLLNRP